jgi:tRNA pseudouridine55 synthase
LGEHRVGHLGTLDPFAEGLLVVVVGRATRLATFAAGWTKAYEGVIRLGVTTDTDDATGAVLRTETMEVTAAQLAAALAQFRGGYEQRPPAYSAVKIAGERAYRRARRGEVVEPAARRVEIEQLELVEYRAPDVRFRATVGSGTYVRSLARDIGAVLGCGAHLLTLRRTAVGPLRLKEAVAPDAVTAADLRDPAALVAHLPRREVSAAERDSVVHGRPIGRDPITATSFRTESFRDSRSPVALFAGAELLAVGEVEGEVLKPRVVVTDA